MTEQLNDIEILRSVPLFNSLSDAEILTILQSPDNSIEVYDAKQGILRESEVGTCMYVILEGTCEVYVRGLGGAVGRDITLATLRKGDFFGEQSLDTDTTGRRNASVRALHSAKVFKIDKKHVLLCLHGEVEESEDVTMPVMSSEDREVRQIVEGMRLFQSLTESELLKVGLWTKVLSVGPGDFVIKESEKADAMFVVLDGNVEIFTLDDGGKITMLANLERGNHFGEQALMPGSDGKRNAYARTDGVARLIQIPKAYFRLVLDRDGDLAKSLEKIGSSQKKTIGDIQKG
jgi:CRP/FNR family cyclic AMP-dependent transcriptional regulator